MSMRTTEGGEDAEDIGRELTTKTMTAR